jgi:hypothetical protein
MSGIDRSEYAKISMGLIVSYSKNEIKKIKYIIQYHQYWNTRLREKLKKGGISFYKKTDIEHRIHRNKIIIRGMSEYIIELKNDIKTSQRNYDKIKK